MEIPSQMNPMQAIREAERQLGDLGIQPGQYSAVLKLLKVRESAQAKIEETRIRQFWDDAYKLALQIQAGNKIKEIASYLHRFAGHVAEQTLQRACVEVPPTYKDISALVDDLPSMNGPIEGSDLIYE